MPIFPTTAFDDISGANGETLGQGGRLAVNWQTHGNPLRMRWKSPNFEHRQRWEVPPLVSRPHDGCGLLCVSDGPGLPRGACLNMVGSAECQTNQCHERSAQWYRGPRQGCT